MTLHIRLPFPTLALRGTIARRILVNWRVDPAAARRLVPTPFRPALVRGHALAGICLIRLERVRPSFLPAALGLASENAAHRIAVEWDDGRSRRRGVYIPRRDTSSRWNRLAGGRLFAGRQHAATFRVRESAERIEVEMRSRDGDVSVRVVARPAREWPTGSVFGALDEVRAFFEAGSEGWSPSSTGGGLEGIELRTPPWRAEPLEVELAESSWIESPDVFPPGSAALDGAILLRNLTHEWRRLPALSSPDRVRAPRRRSRSAFFDIP